MMKKEKMVDYNNIDVFKFMFSIVVVMIHTKPIETISETISWYFSNTFCNLAVPFFFIASGFLFFNKLDGDKEHEKQKLKRYATHLLRMYVVWCIVWFPWKLLGMMQQGGITIHNILLYIRDVLFISGGDALWYLLALVVSIVLVYFLYKQIKNPTMIVAIAAVFYIIRVLLGSWYELFGDKSIIKMYFALFKGTDNALLCGFVFVAIGLMVAKQEDKLETNTKLLFLVISFALVVVEAYIVKQGEFNRDGVCNLLSIPVTSYFLFEIILSIKVQGNTEKYRYLRECSALIYLSHCVIIRTVKMAFAIVDVNIRGVFLFAITFGLSFVFSNIVIYLVKKRKIKFLKLFY